MDEKNVYQEYAVEKLRYDGIPTGAIETYTGKSPSDLSSDDLVNFFRSPLYEKMKEMKGQVQNMYGGSNSMPNVVKGMQKVYTTGHSLLDSGYNQEKIVA